MHLFILSGQSNMAGLDPDLSFTPTVSQAYGRDNIIVIKDAQVGQPIRHWYKQWKPANGDIPKAKGDLYDRLMQKVGGAIYNTRIKTITFIWMQGERDAREGHGEVYAVSLEGLIDQLKKDLERDDIYFVIGRISDFDMDNSRYPHWTRVREAQMKIAEADPRSMWVNTDDLNGPRGRLHYTKEGYRILGRRFAEGAIELIKRGQ